METISTKSLEIISGVEAIDEPDITVFRLAGFLILKARWDEIQIETVRFDGSEQETPLSGSKMFGSVSFWQLPYNLFGYLVIKGRHSDGKQIICEANLDPFEGTEYSHLLKVRLLPEASVGETPWGYHAQTFVDLIRTREAENPAKLPQEVMSMEWSIVRGTRSPLKRRFLELDQDFRLAVVQLDKIIDDANSDWNKRSGGKPFTVGDFAKALCERHHEVVALSVVGLTKLADLIHEATSEGSLRIQQLAMRFGEAYAEQAATIWLDAAPIIVAQKFDVNDLEETGLAPTGRLVRLNTLILSEQDEISLKCVPDAFLVDLELPDGSIRPSDMNSIRVRNGAIEWDERLVKRSLRNVTQLVENHELKWSTIAATELMQTSLNIGKKAHADLEILEQNDDLAEWFVNSVELHDNLLISVSKLSEEKLWLERSLPQKIIRRLFSYLFGGEHHNFANKINFCELVNSNAIYETLSQVDKILAYDNRYDRVLRDNAETQGIRIVSPVDGRCAVLLFLIGFREGGEQKQNQFVTCLLADDAKGAAEIARTHLLSNDMKAVEL